MKKLVRQLATVFCVLVLCLTPAFALSVEDALALLEELYVDPLPAAAYEAATLDELFAALGDMNTYYMSAADYEEFTSSVESESSVTGIGAGIEYTADGILLTSILPGSGAEEAGLLPGDLIVAINNYSCVPASEQHRSLIIGEEGTTVGLTVQHADGTRQDYSIERRLIEIHNTVVTYEDGIGYIDCNSFGLKTPVYFKEAFEAYPDAKFWIIDLRSNVGGLADSAVDILSYILGPGPKLYYADSEDWSYYTLTVDDAITDRPVIVLVNGWSASSSEILSGGIATSDAGIVIGSRTYGKGTAQIVLDSETNPELFSDDSLKLTAYRFYGPTGNTTDHIGVIPTLYVPDDMTAGVASLLHVDEPESSEYLTMQLNGRTFYVDPAAAQNAGAEDALSTLLSALPPDVNIVHVSEDTYTRISAEEALGRFGDSSLYRGLADAASSPFAKEINTLAVYDILDDLSEETNLYEPERNMTRAELCSVIAHALNITTKSPSLFTDVTEDQWYCGEVNAIARLGFVNGIGDGLFDPDSPLTQEQFITVMGRLASFLNLDVAGGLTQMPDTSELIDLSAYAEWAQDSATILSVFSASSGNDDGIMLWDELSQINPQANITRGQAAATICHLLKSLSILAY